MANYKSGQILKILKYGKLAILQKVCVLPTYCPLLIGLCVNLRWNRMHAMAIWMYQSIQDSKCTWQVLGFCFVFEHMALFEFMWWQVDMHPHCKLAMFLAWETTIFAMANSYIFAIFCKQGLCLVQASYSSRDVMANFQPIFTMGIFNLQFCFGNV